MVVDDTDFLAGDGSGSIRSASSKASNASQWRVDRRCAPPHSD
jgi:hypothetical protein